MKIEELFSHTFKALREQIDSEAIRKQVDFLLPSMPMVEACRAEEFDFFQPWIDLGRLTVDQMHHAAERYLLGKSKSGATIFWMIDDLCRPLDALIAPDTWISSLLKKREPLLMSWRPRRCLFGEHLLSHTEITEITEIIKTHTEFSEQREQRELAQTLSSHDENRYKQITESTEIFKTHTEFSEQREQRELAQTLSSRDENRYKQITESTEIKGHTDLANLTDIKFSNSQILDKKDSSNSQVLDKKDSCASNSFRDFRDFCVTNKPVCVVESPVSAVILSELYPNSIWLSTVPNTHFTIDLLEPLRGRTIKVYPHTDATLSNYLSWLEIADIARQAYHLDITVSCTLEDTASPSQKDRGIDILQYLYELYSNPKE